MRLIQVSDRKPSSTFCIETVRAVVRTFFLDTLSLNQVDLLSCLGPLVARQQIIIRIHQHPIKHLETNAASDPSAPGQPVCTSHPTSHHLAQSFPNFFCKLSDVRYRGGMSTSECRRHQTELRLLRKQLPELLLQPPLSSTP